MIGMSTYVSRDGFDWTGLEWDSYNTGSYSDPQPFCYVKHIGNYRYPSSIGPGECHSIFWDDQSRMFVDYCRTNNGSVRTIGRIESADGIHWTYPDRIVLQPDLKDPFRCQFYSAGALRCGTSIVLLVHCCNLQRWSINCQLATSRDGYNFTRVADRQEFIPNGPEGSATAGMVFPGAPTPFGDRWLIYSSASSREHNVKDSSQVTALHEMRPDGFVSFNAGEKEGSLVTRNFTWLHDRIRVNANAQGGSVFLEVHDATKINHGVVANLDDAYPEPIKGFNKGDCIPLTSDSLDHEFKFKEAKLSDLRGRYVKLRFYVKNADLYSWTRSRDNEDSTRHEQ